MKTQPSGVFWFMILFLAVGCSVKEDREDCPCRLIMDMGGIDTTLVRQLNLLATSPDGVVFSDTVQAKDFSKLYVRDVPHTQMRINAWAGSGELLIPYGCECPPFYMYSFDADTRGEVCRHTLDLKKNHCRLTVLFDGRDQVPYRLTFRGNVDGYGDDGLPSAGDFACVAYPAEKGAGSHVAVPRQLDSSLLLDVEDEGSAVLKTFAIGEYLQAGGYDWTAEDLEDATVILDYYITGIRITYKGWDKEYSYDITL